MARSAQDATREVFFEFNGMPRAVLVEDNKLKAKQVVRAKATPGDPGSIGAPMPGVVVESKISVGDAVEKGEKVDVAAVTPGMEKKAQEVLAANPDVRAILMECTELPPYSDALRAKTGLPVYDAISACDFFMMGVQDNERFGLQGWIEKWDGAQDPYKFGQELSDQEKRHLVNKAA